MNQENITLHLAASAPVKTQWRRLLEQFNGNIFHSIEWAETCRSNHVNPLFFNWLDSSGRTVGIAVGIASRSPVRYLGRFSKRLNFESYPAVKNNDADLARSMIRQLVAFAKDGGYRSLTIQSYFANVPIPDMAQLGFVTTSRIEFILDLTRTEEELWNRLSGHHQRKIKKAQKHDLLFEEACSVEAMEQLRKLQAATREKRNRRGEHMDMLDSAQYEELGKRYFGLNLGKLYLMTNEKQPVSAAFVTMYAGRALYVYGGSSEKGYEMNAPALLFWKIFSRCRELGCREFNMGGVTASAVNSDSLSHGLYRFKAGFGGRQVSCLSGAAENLRPFRGAFLTIAEKGREAWKSL